MICSRFECNKPIGKHGKKYCSLLCANQGSKRKPTIIYKECKFCGNNFETDSQNRSKIFCNRSCSATYNNTKRNKFKKECLTCGRIVGTYGKYCNSSCRYDFKIQQWLLGNWDATTKEGLSRTIRNYLLSKSDFKCTSPTCCVPGGWSGINPRSQKSALTVNHIDGNSQNNRPENLEVLCPNCHSLTPTYGALNKGSGRKSRY